MRTTEGEQFSGVITAIKPACVLGGKGDDPIAVILEDGKDKPSWFPLPNDNNFVPGENVLITPQTEHHESGGSTTTYQIAKNQ